MASFDVVPLTTTFEDVTVIGLVKIKLSNVMMPVEFLTSTAPLMVDVPTFVFTATSQPPSNMRSTLKLLMVIDSVNVPLSI